MATNRVSPKKGKVVDIPDATITIGTPTASAGQVSIAFTVATTPATGGPVQKYTAVSNPGSVTVSGSTSPIVVTGLTNDTAYTIQVAAANATGRGPLSAASASATPVDPAGFASIATTTVGSGGQATISFTSIPSTFKHLQIRATMRSTFADTDSFLKVNLNSDTGSNYPNHFLNGNGSSAGAFGYDTSQYAYAFLSMYPAASASANLFGSAVIDVLDYQNSNKNKTIRSLGGYDVNGSGVVRLNSSVWLNTAAVTRIDITDYRGGNMAQYSSFALYGIKG